LSDSGCDVLPLIGFEVPHDSRKTPLVAAGAGQRAEISERLLRVERIVGLAENGSLEVIHDSLPLAIESIGAAKGRGSLRNLGSDVVSCGSKNTQAHGPPPRTS
jgi:hypothetical protein